MTSGMERLVAAVEGRVADRIPVFCNLLDQGARELGVSSPEYYSSGELVARAQLRMREKYGYDNVWSLFYVGKEAELLGCREVQFADDGPPNVKDFVIKTWDDVERLEIPEDLAGHPAFEQTQRCLEILRAEVGGTYPICAYLTGSMALPALLMGMERWFELLLIGPADVRDELLRKCSLFYQRQAAQMRAAGADVLLYSNPFGSTDFVPMRMIEELVLPWMERDLAPGGTGGVVYYCGSARFNKVIDRVIERLGISTYYLSPLDDTAEGKATIAGRGLTCGVINDIKLVDWTPDQTRAEVKRIIDAGKPGGRFLFGTLVMPLAIPERNIRALLDAAFEFGRQDG
jgi:uroporphyrinogen decarboxylase